MQWFSQVKEIFQKHTDLKEKITPQLAMTVLLIEIMRLDGELKQEEEYYLSQLLQSKFSLDELQTTQLVQLANRKLEESTDYHQFTHALNEQLTIAEKINLLVSLWEMANVDDKVDALEEHVIRKLADLLHLRHSEFIQAKNLALQSGA